MRKVVTPIYRVQTMARAIRANASVQASFDSYILNLARIFMLGVVGMVLVFDDKIKLLFLLCDYGRSAAGIIYGCISSKSAHFIAVKLSAVL